MFRYIFLALLLLSAGGLIPQALACTSQEWFLIGDPVQGPSQSFISSKPCSGEGEAQFTNDDGEQSKDDGTKAESFQKEHLGEETKGYTVPAEEMLIHFE